MNCGGTLPGSLIIRTRGQINLRSILTLIRLNSTFSKLICPSGQRRIEILARLDLLARRKRVKGFTLFEIPLVRTGAFGRRLNRL